MSESGEALQRIALENGVVRDVPERAGLEAEEPTVDPVLGARLLPETAHAQVPVELRDTELDLGAHHRHRRQAAVPAVVADQAPDVDVGHPIRVGRAEGPLPQQRPGLFDPTARRRVHARVDAAHDHAGRPVPRVDDFFYELAPVAGAEHDPGRAVSGVDVDDIPDDRHPADLDQRLRDRLGVLLEPRAPAPAKDYDVVDGGHDGELSSIPAAQGGGPGAAPLPFDLAAHVTAREVVVDDAAGLHGRVDRGRAEKAEAAPLELLG